MRTLLLMAWSCASPIQERCIDRDGDGVPSCPDGSGPDCNDLDPAVFPDATEQCNGVDDDCDGSLAPFEVDADGDGGTACIDCDDADPSAHMLDVDGDGWSPCAGDCDDSSVIRYPGAMERCNFVDDDCDGKVDDTFPHFAWGMDRDGDGWARPDDLVEACKSPGGSSWVTRVGDCNDEDAEIHPEAIEHCNGVDDDCSGQTDGSDATDIQVWWADADGDGFGNADAAIVACESPPGAVDNAADCDDAEPMRAPDQPETADGLDNDCNGIVDDLP
jgi:hypothetical protein